MSIVQQLWRTHYLIWLKHIFRGTALFCYPHSLTLCPSNDKQHHGIYHPIFQQTVSLTTQTSFPTDTKALAFPLKRPTRFLLSITTYLVPYRFSISRDAQYQPLCISYPCPTFPFPLPDALSLVLFHFSIRREHRPHTNCPPANPLLSSSLSVAFTRFNLSSTLLSRAPKSESRRRYFALALLDFVFPISLLYI